MSLQEEGTWGILTPRAQGHSVITQWASFVEEGIPVCKDTESLLPLSSLRLVPPKFEKRCKVNSKGIEYSTRMALANACLILGKVVGCRIWFILFSPFYVFRGDLTSSHNAMLSFGFGS